MKENITAFEGTLHKLTVNVSGVEDFSDYLVYGAAQPYGCSKCAHFEVVTKTEGTCEMIIPALSCGIYKYQLFIKRISTNQEFLILEGEINVKDRLCDCSAVTSNDETATVVDATFSADTVEVNVSIQEGAEGKPGPQGPAGGVNEEEMQEILEPYATKEYVDEKIESGSSSVKLTAEDKVRMAENYYGVSVDRCKYYYLYNEYGALAATNNEEVLKMAFFDTSYQELDSIYVSGVNVQNFLGREVIQVDGRPFMSVLDSLNLKRLISGDSINYFEPNRTAGHTDIEIKNTSLEEATLNIEGILNSLDVSGNSCLNTINLVGENEKISSLNLSNSYFEDTEVFKNLYFTSGLYLPNSKFNSIVFNNLGANSITGRSNTNLKTVNLIFNNTYSYSSLSVDFENCTELETFKASFPEERLLALNGGFRGNKKLKTFELENVKIKKLGGNFFENCESLENFTISLENIDPTDSYAFYYNVFYGCNLNAESVRNIIETLPHQTAGYSNNVYITINESARDVVRELLGLEVTYEFKGYSSSWNQISYKNRWMNFNYRKN